MSVGAGPVLLPASLTPALAPHLQRPPFLPPHPPFFPAFATFLQTLCLHIPAEGTHCYPSFPGPAARICSYPSSSHFPHTHLAPTPTPIYYSPFSRTPRVT